MLLSLLATCVSVVSVQVVLITYYLRALLFVVSFLFKRDASYIDAVNIFYLSKLPLHAMTSICYFWPWQEKHLIILHIFDVIMTNMKKSGVLLLLNWGRGEVGIGLHLVLSTVCQNPRFQTCIAVYFFLHSLDLFIFRLRRVSSAASLRIARLPFHIFIFCDIFPNFHLPLHFTHLHEKQIFLFEHLSSLILSIILLYIHYYKL